jgi:hypothetical protein
MLNRYMIKNSYVKIYYPAEILNYKIILISNNQMTIHIRNQKISFIFLKKKHRKKEILISKHILPINMI